MGKDINKTCFHGKADRYSVMYTDTKIIKNGSVLSVAPTILFLKTLWNLQTWKEDQRMTDEYWYLATPYTKYPGGRQQAFLDACSMASRALIAHVNVYFPIAHGHSVAEAAGNKLDAEDGAFWIRVVTPMMKNARGCLVGMLPGWEESWGIQEEIKFFRMMKKPVVHWDPIHPVPTWAIKRQEVA